MLKSKFLAAGFILFAACSSDLAHLAPFDSDAPTSKQAKAKLTGTVTLEGETDFLQVSVQLIGSSRTYSADTLADGKVTIAGIVPGSYNLRIGTRYFETVDESVTFDLAENKSLGDVILKAKTSKVFGNAMLEKAVNNELQSEGGVSLTLSRAGSVRTPETSPAFLSFAEESPGATLGAVSASNGAYEFDGVPAGKYTLSASAPDIDGQELGEVTVTGDGDVQMDDVVLHPLTGFFDIVGSANGVPSSLYTQLALVTLKLSGFSASKMKIGETVTGNVQDCNYKPAVAYAASAQVTLSHEGRNILCVVFIGGDDKETAPSLGSIVFDKTAPVLPSVTINNRASFVTSNIVTLAFSAVDATSGVTHLMMSEATSFTNAVWQPFVPVLVYGFASTAEGTKNIYVMFRDAAGNYSIPNTATTELDTAAPIFTAPLLIDNGSPLTTSHVVTVSISASGASEMQISEDSGFAGATWITASPTATFNLSAGEAVPKTLYVRLRDGAGNLSSATQTASISIDSVAPSFNSFAGTAVTNGTSVTLALNATGTPANMRLSLDSAFGTGTGWVAYASTASFSFIPAVDGAYSIYAQINDAAGNLSGVLSFTVTRDSIAPNVVSVTIAEGALVGGLAVNIHSSVEDAAHMQIDDDSAFTGAVWQTYFTSRQYTLADAEGLQQVYVRFKDAAGNLSGTSNPSITVDRLAPTGITVTTAAATTQQRITLSLGATGAAMMMISEDSGIVATNFAGASWETYAVQKLFDLTSGDGSKRVYVKYKDAVGNQSSTVSVVVELDSTAPQSPSLAISTPILGYANQITVPLTLAAVGANSMIVSESSAFTGASWEAFTASKNFVLANLQGSHTIYAKYKDNAGNETAIVSASVVLDTVKPTVSRVQIDEGAYAKNATVHLTLFATGADTMKVAESSDFTAVSSIPYASVSAFDLTGGDGLKTVYVQFTDAAGNNSATYSAAVTLDTLKPAAPVLALNAGAVYATSRSISIGITTDGSASEMQVSEDSLFGGAAWQTVSTPLSYSLGSVDDGSKPVHVRLRDLAGNVSDAGTASILLDTQAPENIFITKAAAPQDYSNSNTSIWMNVGASGASAMRLSIDGTMDSELWQTLAAQAAVTVATGDGLKNVIVQFKDLAGNVSQLAQTSFFLDTLVPQVGTLSFFDGVYSNHTNVGLQLNASGADFFQTSYDGAFDTEPLLFMQPVSQVTLTGADGVKWLWVRFGDRALNYSTPVSVTIALDRQAPVAGSPAISVNGGDAYTTAQLVELSLDVAGADYMQIANQSNFPPEPWESVATSTVWQLEQGPGTKQVFVRFKDNAGNIAGPYAASITYDAAAPDIAKVNLNQGADYTNSAIVNLHAQARLAFGEIVEMRYGTDFSFTTDTTGWVSFSSDVTHTVASGDGVKTVYAQFRDLAGNTTAVFSDSIILDATVPSSASISINGGASFTNNLTGDVDLTLAAGDGASGVIAMQVSNTGIFAGQPMPFLTPFHWQLNTATNGLKSVWVRFADRAGNFSDAVSSSIILDRGAPTGTVTVNGGDQYATSSVAVLTLTSADANGVAEYMVADNPGFGGGFWQPNTTSAGFLLPSQQGNVKVWAKFRDSAGNESMPVFDEIQLDTIAPQFDSIKVPLVTNNRIVAVQLFAPPGPNATYMRLSEDSDFADVNGAWVTYSNAATFWASAGEGTKTIYAQLKDDAGLESVVRTANSELDLSAPEIPVVKIRQGAYINNALVDVEVTAQNSFEMLVSQYAPMTDATWTPFNPVKPFPLAGTDGVKTVYVKVRDSAGNPSGAGSASATLDRIAPVPNASPLKINLGLPTTTSSFVTLSFNVTGADELQVSDDGGFGDASWIPYSATRTFTLSPGDGNKIVYARFRDFAGNPAGPVSDDISLDTKAPSVPFITAAYAMTTSTAITLSLGAADADRVKLSQNPDFSGAAWLTLSSPRTFNLTGADGSKTIYAKFLRTASGFESAIVNTGVMLDQAAPTAVTVTTANNVYFTRSKDVLLQLSAADDVSGLDTVEISESPTFFDRDLISMRSLYSYRLRETVNQGYHAIYARYRDRAGNAAAAVSTAVVFDTLAPSGTFSISGDPVRVNSQFVLLDLSSSDAVGVRIWNDSGTPAEMTYAPNMVWAIRAIQDNPTTVNVSFVDAAGNASAAYSRVVTYDTVPAGISSFALSVTTSSSQINLAWAPSFLPNVASYKWYRHYNGVRTLGGTVAAAVTQTTVGNPLAGEEFSISAVYGDGLESALSNAAVESVAAVRTKGILLVDDDSGTASVENNLLLPLTGAGLSVDTVTVASGADGPGIDTLKDYQVVIWSSGEGPTAPTLSPADRGVAQQYLESGGNLLYLGAHAMDDADTATFIKRWGHTGRVETALPGIEKLYVPAGDLGGLGGFEFPVGPAMTGANAVYGSALAEPFLNAGKPVGVRYPMAGTTAGYRLAYTALPTTGLYQRNVFSFNLEDINIPVSTDPGIIPLALGDDDSIQIVFGFPFQLGSETYTSAYVNSNGMLNFEEAVNTPPYPMFPTTDTANYPGASVTGYWTDLDPSGGGTVFVKLMADTAYVVWENVPIKNPDTPGVYGGYVTTAVMISDSNLMMLTRTGQVQTALFRFDTPMVDIGFEDANGIGFGDPRSTTDKMCCEGEDLSVSAYFYRDVIPESQTLLNNLVRWLGAPAGVRKISPRYFTVSSIVSGATQMRVSTDGSLDTENPQTYSSSLPVTSFTSGDGVKTVQAVFIDAAGNVTSVFTDSRSVDTSAPLVKNVVLLDPATGSNAFSRSRTVTLQVAALAGTLDYMRVSESPVFVDGGWVPYVENTTFTLSEGDGVKRVYVWLKDASGNISAPGVGSIEIDTVPPATFAIGNSLAKTSPFYINTSYGEAVAPAAFDWNAGVDTNLSNKYFLLRDLPFSFPFYGTSYSRITLWKEGLITFGTPDPSNDVIPMPADSDADPELVIAGLPLVAPLYMAGLAYPKASQDIFTESGTESGVAYYMVRWAAQDERTQNPVNVALKLYANGNIRLFYGSGNSGVDGHSVISRGQDQNIHFARYDGQSELANLDSLLFTPNASVDSRVKLYFRYHFESGPGTWTDSGIEAPTVFDALAFYPPFGAGTYDFYTAGIDSAGNVEPAPATADISIVFDNIAPLPPAQLHAEASDDAVYIEWDPSLSPDVAGYRVYYGDSASFAGTDALEGESPIDVPPTPHVTLTNIEPGKTTYVAVTALDRVGNESPRPTGVSFLLPHAMRRVGTLGTGEIESAQVIDNGILVVSVESDQRHYDWYKTQNPYAAALLSRTQLNPESKSVFLYDQYLFTGDLRAEIDVPGMYGGQTNFSTGYFMDAVTSALLVASEIGGPTTFSTHDMITNASPFPSYFGYSQGIHVERENVYLSAGPCCGPGNFELHALEIGPAGETLHGKIASMSTFFGDFDVASDLLAVANVSGYSGWDAGSIDITDLSALPATTYVGAVSGFGPRYVSWAGDRIVSADQQGILRLVDAGDVTAATVESSIALGNTGSGVNIVGSVGFANTLTGLEIFEMGELLPDGLRILYQNTIGSVQAVATSRDYVYVADFSSLRIMLLRDGQFSLISTYSPFNAVAMAVSGNYLFAFNSMDNGALNVYDVSNPANPLQVWTSTGIYFDVHTSNLQIIGTTLFSDRRAYDISNPRSPVLLYEYGNTGAFHTVTVRAGGDFLYYYDKDDAYLGIYAPTAGGPDLVGYMNGITNVRDFVVDGDKVFLYRGTYRMDCCTPTWNQLLVLDVSVPSSPVVAATFDLGTEGTPNGAQMGNEGLLAAHRGFVYLTLNEIVNFQLENSIFQVDVRDLANPLLTLQFRMNEGENAVPPLILSQRGYILAAGSNRMQAFRVTANVPVQESGMAGLGDMSRVAIGDRYIYYAGGSTIHQVERRAPAVVLGLVGAGEVAVTKRGNSLQLYDPPGVPAAALTADGTGRFDLASAAYDTAGEVCQALRDTGRLTCSLRVPSNSASAEANDAFGIRVKPGKFVSLRAPKVRLSTTLPNGVTITDLAFDDHRLFVTAAPFGVPAAIPNQGLYVVSPKDLSWKHHPVFANPAFSVAVRDSWAYVGVQGAVLAYNWTTQSLGTGVGAEASTFVSLMSRDHDTLFTLAGPSGCGNRIYVSAQATKGSLVISGTEYCTNSPIRSFASLGDGWVAVLTDNGLAFAQFNGATFLNVKDYPNVTGDNLKVVNGRLLIGQGGRIEVLDVTTLPPANLISRNIEFDGSMRDVDVLGDMVAIATSNGPVFYRLK